MCNNPVSLLLNFALTTLVRCQQSLRFFTQSLRFVQFAADALGALVQHTHQQRWDLEVQQNADEDEETNGHHEIGVRQREERLVSGSKSRACDQRSGGNSHDTVHVAHPFICASTAAATVLSSA
jgi:hypothetical protein